MRIDWLSVRNFKCFIAREIDLSRAPDALPGTGSFHLLIGENGSGKSAVLDALAVAISSIFSREKAFGPRRLTERDVRRKPPDQFLEEVRGVAEVQLAKPAVVHVRGEVFDHSAEWGHWFSQGKWEPVWKQWSATATALAAECQAILEDGPTRVLPVFCYYGTGRLHAPKSYGSPEFLPRKQRQIAYVRAADPGSNYHEMLSWFKTQEAERVQFPERSAKHARLETVYGAVQSLLPGCQRVVYDLSRDELVVVIGERPPLPLESLSDGYRTMLAMVADLAIRAVTLNPVLGPEALTKTPGVVLIDELDLHLHPRWQRSVAGDLRRVFPSVQFVCTSHSPQIIGEVPRTEILDLDQAEPGPPSIARGADTNWILDHVMGAASRNAEAAALIEAAEDSMEQDDLTAATTAVEKLRTMMDGEDGESVRLRSSIDTLEALQRADD